MSDSNIKKVVLAYSGGLDTSVIIPWLIDTYKCEVIAYAADVGQKEELDGLELVEEPTEEAEDESEPEEAEKEAAEEPAEEKPEPEEAAEDKIVEDLEELDALDDGGAD